MKPDLEATVLSTIMIIIVAWPAISTWITAYDSGPGSPATPRPNISSSSFLERAGAPRTYSVSIDIPRSPSPYARDERDSGFSSKHQISISMEGTTATVTVTTTVTRTVPRPQNTSGATAAGSEELEPRPPGAAALSYVAVAIIFGLIGFIFGILASIRMGVGSCTRRSRRI